MTPEEQKDYNKLTPEGKKFYDLYQGMHPEWSHPQLITMVSICVQKPFTEPDGKTIQQILAECIMKAQQFMAELFPNLYITVGVIFNTIGDAIKRAAQVTWSFIENLFSKFTV